MCGVLVMQMLFLETRQLLFGVLAFQFEFDVPPNVIVVLLPIFFVLL